MIDLRTQSAINHLIRASHTLLDGAAALDRLDDLSAKQHSEELREASKAIELWIVHLKREQDVGDKL